MCRMEHTMETKSNERDALRRRAILEAAYACFLQFGYARTSLDDIAKRAHISRPLIYTRFKSKEDILAAVFEHIFEQRYPAVEQALAAPGRKREKLLNIYEILLLEPWEEGIGSPMGVELYEVCLQLLPLQEKAYTQRCLQYTQAILGEQELSEVFMLAIDGLQSDIPTTDVLRRRLQILIEHFAGE